jgi:hypothetical protein
MIIILIFCFFYNLIKEYKFCFIQIKNYHELLTKERKYLYYIFILYFLFGKKMKIF